MYYYNQIEFKIIVAIYLILGIITAILCYKESKQQGRSTLEWVLFGYFLPLIPLFILKNLKKT